jgi:hypothetical protein
MKNPDPSSPFEDDALDFLAESLDPADRPSAEASKVLPDSVRDEDRLYTDEFIRQDERASRALLLSFICAGVISLGVGIWYLATRSQAPQPNVPLQVPEQPSFPTPRLNPSQTVLPNSSGQSLPPTDSGVMSGEKPGATSLPSALKTPPSGLSTPPPPP